MKHIIKLFLILTCINCASINALNILIVGNGAREHALAWKVAQSPHVEKIFVAPGNGGTATEVKTENIAIPATDIPALIEFAQTHHIDLTIVGSETPLALGIVDQFSQHRLACLGPTQAAARIESSKVFAKDFMKRHNIPTAEYQAFTNAHDAHDYINNHQPPFVVKADGLAAGKGVFIAHTRQEALETITDLIEKRSLSDAGKQIVIEEFLEGKEVSFIVLTDGKNYLPLLPSQDHKKLLDGDKGPNTGGMGAYCPVPFVTPELHTRIMKEIIEPTIVGMAHEGNPFVGFLYAGLMVTPQGEPKVLEFNARLGDPEAEVLLMCLDSDLIKACQAALQQKLDTISLRWKQELAVSIVVAAAEYPARGSVGQRLWLPREQGDDWKIFHAGTAIKDGQIFSNGGRVLCMTARGSTLKEAQQKAYQYLLAIGLKNMHYRTDIGWQGL
jgi:phosphoribosylamine--glycine ligase